MKNFTFYSVNESGHRLEYIEFTESLLGGTRISGLDLLRTKKPLLFLMVEDSFFLYVIVALIRAMLGRRTAGLVFRAKECIGCSSLKLKIKYVAMYFLKFINSINSISIVPFFTYPAMENVCDGWIYDFQFWDREFLESRVDLKVTDVTSEELRAKANGRSIVCAVGKQDKNKGFDKFANLYLSSEDIRNKYLFVSGGKIDGVDLMIVDEFEKLGGCIINKRISDSELVGLYQAADIVWACYSPFYDQSSGVLGRALQYNKTVVVRRGSIADKLASKSGGKVISLVGADCEEFIVNANHKFVDEIGQSDVDDRSISLNTLKAALGE